MFNNLTAKQVAELVIGESLRNYQPAWDRFLAEVNGKPVEFITDVIQAIPDTGIVGDNEPGAMQSAAIMYLTNLIMPTMIVEALAATEENNFAIAKKLRSTLPFAHLRRLLVYELEKRIGEAVNQGAVYHVMALVLGGPETDDWIEMLLAE